MGEVWMKNNPDYIARLDELKEQMMEDLMALIRCRSVQGEAREGAPFGDGPAEALEFMLNTGRREGMEAVSLDGAAGYIEYGPSGEELFGILSHLDVVPAGNGWTVEAFDPVLKEGRIYGRGSSDDKGPTIAAFYALKALKDCGYDFTKRVRMIFGLNEETGEESIRYYCDREEIPSFSIVPDSDFPVVRAEKGIMTFDLVKRFGIHHNNGPEIKSIKGGAAANMVPDHAEALIDHIEDIPSVQEHVKRFASDTGASVFCEERGEHSVLIRAEGKSAHGSAPWKGVNAIAVLLEMLGTMKFGSEEMQELLEFYISHIGFDHYGERLGISLTDGESGRLIMNVGVIAMDEREFRLTVNVRIPVTFGEKDVFSGLISLLTEYGIDFEKKMYQAPLYYQEDDSRIQQLLEIYRRHTGDTESRPLIIGGGTYARQMKNAVAFGALYPGDEDRMHGADEYISVDRLLQTARIYAETICEFAVKKETDV
ncbi:MAG: dipeptidase PepV [Firmicutes bacterium]|nr:dipeptidase PepV [Bacillota bacterium]